MSNRMRNLTIALVTVAVLSGALAVSPAAAQAPRTLIDWLLVDRITVLNGNVDVVSGDMTLDAGDFAATAGDVTAGGTLDVTGAATLNSTLDVDGNVTAGSGSFTVADDMLIDGQTDSNQLRVQGYTAQTTKSLVVEQSDGTDVFTVDNDGSTVVGSDLNTGAQAPIAVTEGSTITPTGTYQPLTAAGAVSAGGIAAGADGDLLVLINESANAITLVDSSTLKLSGNAVLGQFDSITLLSDGTNWIMLSQENN